MSSPCWADDRVVFDSELLTSNSYPLQILLLNGREFEEPYYK